MSAIHFDIIAYLADSSVDGIIVIIIVVITIKITAINQVKVIIEPLTCQ